mmetsp:Transcript_51117/g.94604  ORF Transcript_51117/g.94604 Transcript_51117/m.94604 type:complete len:461 (-) Transcript_51117:103-1485(-)
MAPVETQFYDLLDVGPTATDADLRKAYKKQALRLHPDKGGNPDEFKRMKEAYDVLSDPQKRNLYDKYGPEVVVLLEGNASPTLVMMALSRVGLVERCCFLCIIASLFLLILSPLILLSLRWDRDVTYPWTVVFAPLWLFQAALLCLVCACVHAPPLDAEDEADEELRRMHEERSGQAREIRFAGGAILLYLMVAELLIALKLQGSLQISWFLVLLPWALTESTLLFVYIRRAPGRFAAANPEAAGRAEAEGGFLKSTAFWQVLVQSVWGVCIRMLTYVLVAARGDKVIQCSWLVCVVPLTVGEVVQVVQACSRSFARGRTEIPAEETGEPDDDGGAYEGCGTCMLATFWLSMFYCAAFKMDGFHLSGFLVFSPIFTCMGAIACCFACIACQLSPERVSAMAQEENANINVTQESAGYGTVAPPPVVVSDVGAAELGRAASVVATNDSAATSSADGTATTS